jgi:subtilisin family serine protease
MHGTHVAGIAARGNPVIRLSYARITFDVANPAIPPSDARLNDLARSNAETVQWFREHHIRVVNMSWGDVPASYEKDLADNGIGRTAKDREKLARHYFNIESRALYAALKSAPEILFVTSASNSNTNNQFEEEIPSSFKLPNLIAVGALDQAGNETNFSSYGSNVLVDAEGLAVESVVPGGSKVKMSGTSMASPQVANLAAKLLAIDPQLSPPQLIAFIQKGSDTSADGRRHLMNSKHTVEMLLSNNTGP